MDLILLRQICVPALPTCTTKKMVGLFGTTSSRHHGQWPSAAKHKATLSELHHPEFASWSQMAVQSECGVNRVINFHCESQMAVYSSASSDSIWGLHTQDQHQKHGNASHPWLHQRLRLHICCASSIKLPQVPIHLSGSQKTYATISCSWGSLPKHIWARQI